MKNPLWIIVLTAALILPGCQSSIKETPDKPENDSGGSESVSAEPERVTVQHILISFRGAIPEDSVTRTQAEAEALAEDIYLRAKAGENFDDLVKEYTDDQVPGIYKMINSGVEPNRKSELREYPRQGMVRAFGDTGFSLDVGEIGMTEYDPETSKYGWHIIKRLE
jgi:hypothetical protein